MRNYLTIQTVQIAEKSNWWLIWLLTGINFSYDRISIGGPLRALGFALLINLECDSQILPSGLGSGLMINCSQSNCQSEATKASPDDPDQLCTYLQLPIKKFLKPSLPPLPNLVVFSL
jgi:hypothetical protein